MSPNSESATARSGRWPPRRFAWIGVLAVVAVALLIGSTRDPAARTPDEQVTQRVQSLSESVMCPTCRGQSVADSDSSAARGIRAHIERRIGEGAGNDQIRDELATIYGEEVLLTPGRSGWQGLVWVLPVAALVGAVAGIAFAFHRWRQRSTPQVSAADRELVVRALDGSSASPP